jgi:hypothetical protein
LSAPAARTACCFAGLLATAGTWALGWRTLRELAEQARRLDTQRAFLKATRVQLSHPCAFLVLVAGLVRVVTPAQRGALR